MTGAEAPRNAEEADELIPSPKRILDTMMRKPGLDLDGFRISLWSGLYTSSVFADIQRTTGLLRDEHNVLSCLAYYGPLTAKSISQALGRPKNSISRAVDGLLARKLVRSEPVEWDRRHLRLTIEPPGSHLIARTTAKCRARQEEMLRVLTPIERVALDHLLAKLMNDVGAWLPK
jgi:MarR family transcriptional regulator, temperature-dependent positive regulator of motility